MLPDFVANRDQIVRDAEIGKHRQFVGPAHGRRGVERMLRISTRVLPETAASSAARSIFHSGGWRRTNFGTPPASADQRHIGIVERLEADHFVAGRDAGEDRRGQRLGRARGDHHFLCRQVEPLVAGIMIGHRMAELGQAEHRRILVRPFDHCFRRRLQHRFGSAPVGEALAQLDRSALAGAGGHGFEDGGAHPGVERVHGAELVAACIFGCNRRISPTFRLAPIEEDHEQEAATARGCPVDPSGRGGPARPSRGSEALQAVKDIAEARKRWKPDARQIGMGAAIRDRLGGDRRRPALLAGRQEVASAARRRTGFVARSSSYVAPASSCGARPA